MMLTSLPSAPAGNPAERFGQILESLGYARHGQEKMISGITGQEMTCDIYIGIVYYQRLRHMVSDKFQVRQEPGTGRTGHTVAVVNQRGSLDDIAWALTPGSGLSSDLA
jgi:hypothetical protein